jgi:two-component system response regulator AlgR
MKVLIADDEVSARNRLRGLLAEIDPALEVVGEAGDGGEALRLIADFQPDLVLLDIRMPRVAGIETAREIARLPEPPAVIFVTAHEDRALDAFEAGAVDYLLKPVRKQRLEAALGKARRFTGAAWSQLAAALAPEPLPARTHLCAYSRGELRLVPLAAVAYFRAESKYTTVRFDGGEALIEDSLVALEREFGERFVRIHRNALAVLDHAEGLQKLAEGGMGLKFVGMPEVLEVSRRHLAAVRGRLRRVARKS